MSKESLGKLQAVYPLSPVYTQRAVIVGGLALAFFAAMLFAFSIRQNIGYLLLAIAFLFVEIATLFSWVAQRKTILKMFENGFIYKKQVCRWDEIASTEFAKEKDFLGKPKIKLVVEKTSGEKILLSEMIENVEQLAHKIKEKTADGKAV